MAYILLGIGTVLVIYFYAVTTTAEKGDQKKRENGGSCTPRQQDVSEKRKPRIRRCPICGAEMGVSDKLYAEVYKASPRDKVFIKGCPKCHALPGKPESRPDFLQEVEL